MRLPARALAGVVRRSQQLRSGGDALAEGSSLLALDMLLRLAGGSAGLLRALMSGGLAVSQVSQGGHAVRERRPFLARDVLLARSGRPTVLAVGLGLGGG